MVLGKLDWACLSVELSDTVAPHEQYNIVWLPHMTVRNFAPNAQVSYLHPVNLFPTLRPITGAVGPGGDSHLAAQVRSGGDPWPLARRQKIEWGP
jgi:hypothetical protein